MNMQVKSSNGITLVPLESRLMAKRKVFIEGEIDQESACEFIKKIMLLINEDKEMPIDLLINSPGGEVNSGLLMYDVIQAAQAPIRMFCIGHAYSMGAVLFACGNHGRYMLPHSELMIHEPLLGHRVDVNNNILVCGASGCGKTMSITEAHLLETFHSCVIATVTKRRIVEKYKPVFRRRGYIAEDLNFINPSESDVAYDPLEYINSYADIPISCRIHCKSGSRKFCGVVLEIVPTAPP